MLSSRTFRSFHAVPMTRVLQSLTKVNVREISVWNNAVRGGGFWRNPQEHCSMCRVLKSGHLKQTSLMGDVVVRSMSRRKGQEDPSLASLPPFVDPDIGDIIDDEPSTQKRMSQTKVKVKFSWKNSLVTTDALTLLENLYQTHPQLVEFDEDNLTEYFQKMSIHSIHVEQSAKMVIMNPSLLKLSDEKIASVINALRSMGLTESQRGHVLRSIPEIFNFPPKRLQDQFIFLKTYFSKQETIDLISKSVQIFLESEATLRRKLDYLIKDMSHETPNIVSCKAITYPLRHIKMRHEFLIRSGLFKPIPYRKLIKVLEKEYKDKNKPRNKYFKPLEIVCYKDEDFLKVCAKKLLTLNELVAFEELYGAELDVIEENEEEEDEIAMGYTARDEVFDEDEDEPGDAVSLVKAPNSTGFLNEVEGKSCYF